MRKNRVSPGFRCGKKGKLPALLENYPVGNGGHVAMEGSALKMLNSKMNRQGDSVKLSGNCTWAQSRSCMASIPLSIAC